MKSRFMQILAFMCKGSMVMTACILFAARVCATAKACPQQTVHFKISRSDIAMMERAEAQGHMPWRTDPHIVSEVGLGRVEHSLNPQTFDSIPFTRITISNVHEVYRYKLKARHHIDRVTVRKFYWHDPSMGKTYPTVWWPTEVVITDCSKRPAR